MSSRILCGGTTVHDIMKQGCYCADLAIGTLCGFGIFEWISTEGWRRHMFGNGFPQFFQVCNVFLSVSTIFPTFCPFSASVFQSVRCFETVLCTELVARYTFYM